MKSYFHICTCVVLMIHRPSYLASDVTASHQSSVWSTLVCVLLARRLTQMLVHLKYSRDTLCKAILLESEHEHGPRVKWVVCATLRLFAPPRASYSKEDNSQLSKKCEGKYVFFCWLGSFLYGFSV